MLAVAAKERGARFFVHFRGVGVAVWLLLQMTLCCMTAAVWPLLCSCCCFCRHGYLVA